MENNIFLLDYIEDSNILTFKKKVNLFEFTETIGKMNQKHCLNITKRNKYLKVFGKKLFRKHPWLKNKKYKISIEVQHEIDGPLSDFEILKLLTPVIKPKYYVIKKIIIRIKAFFKYLCEWKLKININNIEYKYCLKSMVKIKHNYYELTREEYFCILKEMDDVSKLDIPLEEIVERRDIIWRKVYTEERIK